MGRLQRRRQGAADTAGRLVCGSARNDGTCPAEMSKSFRLCQWVREAFDDAGMQTDLLDLSLLIFE